MLPETELRYSFIYNKQFNPDFTMQDTLHFKKKCAKFEELYIKHIKDILQLIEKHSGDNWKRKYIAIYIISERGRSFSDPLTIRYNENEKYMLVTLAHELLHNNMNKKFPSQKEIHAYMEPILNKVIVNLPMDLSKELNELNERLHKHYVSKS
jgi:uncharacterized protein YqkB